MEGHLGTILRPQICTTALIDTGLREGTLGEAAAAAAADTAEDMGAITSNHLHIAGPNTTAQLTITLLATPTRTALTTSAAEAAGMGVAEEEEEDPMMAGEEEATTAPGAPGVVEVEVTGMAGIKQALNSLSLRIAVRI